MWIMAVAATHLPFHNRMMMRQVELAALIEMALETSLRRLPWIQNGVPRAAGLGVNATRPMTRLAAHFVGVGSRRLQSRVRCRMEVAIDLFVTLGAVRGANKTPLQEWLEE
jgi:hypothetical protein